MKTSPQRWLAIWVATCLVVVLVLGRFDNADARQSDNLNILRLKGSSQYPRLDLLFVGSSYVYSGIDPQIFGNAGYSIYNLGSPSAGPFFFELITEDYLKLAEEKPGKIMLLVDPLMFAPSADNWRLYRIHRYLADPISNEALLFKYGAWADYLPLVCNSAEMGLRNTGRMLSNYYKATVPPDLNRGFMPSDVIVTEQIIRETESYYTHLREASFSTKKADYYADFLKRLQDASHTVILFEIPSHVVTSFLTDSYLNRYDKFVDSLETAGIPVLRKELELDATCYRNIDHLNSKGAALVSSNLVERLRQL